MERNPRTIAQCTFALHSFAILLFAISLKITYFKERDREPFAHVALYKRANMRDSLTSLFTVEQMALVALKKEQCVHDLSKSLTKTSDSLDNSYF